MRKFYLHHPTTDQPIMVKQGETGFYPLINGGRSEVLNQLNSMAGNSEQDIERAMNCSVFGWDIPLASMLVYKGHDISECFGEWKVAVSDEYFSVKGTFATIELAHQYIDGVTA